MFGGGELPPAFSRHANSESDACSVGCSGGVSDGYSSGISESEEAQGRRMLDVQADATRLNADVQSDFVLFIQAFMDRRVFCSHGCLTRVDTNNVATCVVCTSQATQKEIHPCLLEAQRGRATPCKSPIHRSQVVAFVSSRVAGAPVSWCLPFSSFYVIALFLTPTPRSRDTDRCTFRGTQGDFSGVGARVDPPDQHRCSLRHRRTESPTGPGARHRDRA